MTRQAGGKWAKVMFLLGLSTAVVSACQVDQRELSVRDESTGDGDVGDGDLGDGDLGDGDVGDGDIDAGTGGGGVDPFPTGGAPGIDPANCGEGPDPWLNYGIGRGGDWYGGVYRIIDDLSWINEGPVTDFAPVCLTGTLAQSDPGTQTWTFAEVGWAIHETFDEFCFATQVAAPITESAIEVVYYNYSFDDAALLPRNLRVDLYNHDTGEVWCTELFAEAAAVVIPLDSFIKNCFDPDEEQTPYSGEPVTNVNVQLPGSSESTATIDFCVDSIAPIP